MSNVRIPEEQPDRMADHMRRYLEKTTREIPVVTRDRV